MTLDFMKCTKPKHIELSSTNFPSAATYSSMWATSSLALSLMRLTKLRTNALRLYATTSIAKMHKYNQYTSMYRPYGGNFRLHYPGSFISIGGLGINHWKLNDTVICLPYMVCVCPERCLSNTFLSGYNIKINCKNEIKKSLL